MPDVLIGGGNNENGNGAINGLLGLQILEQLGKKVNNGNGHDKPGKES
jgi:hypothetical protein